MSSYFMRGCCVFRDRCNFCDATKCCERVVFNNENGMRAGFVIKVEFCFFV